MPLCKNATSQDYRTYGFFNEGFKIRKDLRKAQFFPGKNGSYSQGAVSGGMRVHGREDWWEIRL